MGKGGGRGERLRGCWELERKGRGKVEGKERGGSGERGNEVSAVRRGLPLSTFGDFSESAGGGGGRIK